MALRSVLDGPVVRGVKKLRAYLVREGLSVPVFSEQHGLSRMSVQKLVAGNMKVVDVELAADLEDATLGEDGFSAVEVRDFVRPKGAREGVDRHAANVTGNGAVRKSVRRPTAKSRRSPMSGNGRSASKNRTASARRSGAR